MTPEAMRLALVLAVAQRDAALKALRQIKRRTDRHDMRYEIARAVLVALTGEHR